MEKFPEEEYSLPFFKEAGYVRRLCPKCGDYYWTQNSEQKTCGEASSSECAEYTFINDPPTKRSYTLPQMRESFLSYFEGKGHTRIKPYPVVARWRQDIYLTHASIIDFQPYVTEGISPPPSNPLVISQPCVRMVDIANTGPTFGRHMTIFEMGGAHAFNYPDKEVYWKDQTVRYHHDWVTQDLGVKSDEIIYKEGVWIGGGNAGPDVECIIRGLEVATLVFMQFKVVNNRFVKLPIKTVDTGYGIDRYAWVSQGALSGFHTVYDQLLDKVFQFSGLTNIDKDLLAKIARVSGIVSLDKTASRLNTRRKEAEFVGMTVKDLDAFLVPIENAFAVADHTKCLSFILSEGVVPSNIQEGYLARLIFRRVYRMLKLLNIQDKLYDIVDMQIDLWSKDFPQLRVMQTEIVEMLKVEEEKFLDTITRGEGMVKRISTELKAKKKHEIPLEILTELYDSHGLPPEIVKQAAEKEELEVKVPDDFYGLIAQKHMEVSKATETESIQNEWLKEAVEDLPETRTLYYENQYQKQFEANVRKVLNNRYVVLDATCFFPEGGGQPADTGILYFGEKKAEVIDVQKIGRVIVHTIQGEAPKVRTTVSGKINWEKRYSLMKNHTATHVIGGAAKRVLGLHVWQYGTRKGHESSRLDISHYRRLSLGEVHKIEKLANEAVYRDIPLEVSWMPRNEAETKYGFRLYQGGAVPGKEIRVVRAGDWDVEACAGTHLKSTGEIGFIKIIHTERVQDGVERLTYSVGLAALNAIQKNEQIVSKATEILNASLEKLDKTAEKLVKELKEANSERRKLIKELAQRESLGLETEDSSESINIDGLKLVLRDFKDSTNVERMVQTASEITKKDECAVTVFYSVDGRNARIVVMAGSEAVEKGVNSDHLVKGAAKSLGGGGGGRPNFAQGGGAKIECLEVAINEIKQTLEKQVKAKR